MPTTFAGSVEAKLLGCLVKLNRADFSPAVVEAILQLDFDPKTAPTCELEVTGQGGESTMEEHEELASYRRIGYFVGFSQSQVQPCPRTRPASS